MFGTLTDGGVDLFEYVSAGLALILVVTGGLLGHSRSLLKRSVGKAQKLLDSKDAELKSKAGELTTQAEALKTKNGELVKKDSEIQEKKNEIARLARQEETLTAERNRLKSQSQVRFDEHRNLEAERVEVLLELEFWRHFAGRVLHDSTSHLAKARAYVSKIPNEDRGPVLDSIDFSLAALSLAAADDCAEMLLQTREASPPFNALPNLRRFVSDWGHTVGQGFRATLPDRDATLIFLGQWAHLEILLTNVFQNAIKHSNMPDAPVELVCTTKDHFACFEMTNSAAPIPKPFMNASMKIQVDGRKRFGLCLMEQIVSGYSGYIRYDSLLAEGKLPPRFRVSIRLPMDG